MGGCRFGRRLRTRDFAPGLLLLTLALPVAAQSPRTGARASAAVIPIRGEINDIMRDSIERRLTDARAAGATTIIFEMDTPGGLVTSALDICRLIKNLPQEMRTIAWVHPSAYSAGAMISVACREIWMSPASSIGDCAPIMVAPTGIQELGQTERAKAESPILQEFRDSASRNGYDPLLSRAMVTVGEEVWWLERLDDPPTRKFVTGDDKKKLVDDADPNDLVWRLVESYTLPGSGKSIHVPQPVDRAGELLTMSQYDAVAYGFAKGIARDTAELTEKLELDRAPALFDKSGWEQFAAWLNSPLLRGLLLVIVMIGAYTEFQHPGLILPGVTALIALAIFLGAPYAAGLASTWTILVLIGGLALLGIEIFLMPGVGVIGLVGTALIVLAILGSFVPREPDMPTFSLPSLQGSWDGLYLGVKVMASSVIVSIVGILLVARYLPRSRVAAGMVLANPDAQMLALSDAHLSVAQVGDVGVVTGDLRPGGQARFGQEVIDVQSQGEYVEAGRRIQVIRRDGMNVIVRPLPKEN
jgi:membrane-bound serine protease (ClpP class)